MPMRIPRPSLLPETSSPSRSSSSYPCTDKNCFFFPPLLPFLTRREFSLPFFFLVLLSQRPPSLLSPSSPLVFIFLCGWPLSSFFSLCRDLVCSSPKRKFRDLRPLPCPPLVFNLSFEHLSLQIVPTRSFDSPLTRTFFFFSLFCYCVSSISPFPYHFPQPLSSYFICTKQFRHSSSAPALR